MDQRDDGERVSGSGDNQCGVDGEVGPAADQRNAEGRENPAGGIWHQVRGLESLNMDKMRRPNDEREIC